MLTGPSRDRSFTQLARRPTSTKEQFSEDSHFVPATANGVEFFGDVGEAALLLLSRSRTDSSSSDRKAGDEEKMSKKLWRERASGSKLRVRGDLTTNQAHDPLRGDVMCRVDSGDSLRGFFRKFFKTRRGQIFGLATSGDQLRDGLALARVARLFPLPEYQGIVIEPALPTSQPGESIILVGSAWLFLSPSAHKIHGEPPLCLGEAKLGERLRKLYDLCCYELEGTDHRFVRNRVTTATYRPERKADVEVDFGVIRRWCRSRTSCLIILEGLHRLGTLGAAKVATSPEHLDAIWNAVSDLEAFDESVPLEILVKSTYYPASEHRVYGLEGVQAEPLEIVYGNRWAYGLEDGHNWIDQLPWDFELWVLGEDPPRKIRPGRKDCPWPRLEIRADLNEADRSIRSLCRKVLLAGSGRRARKPLKEEDVVRLLEFLTKRSDAFDVELVDKRPWAKTVRAVSLPKGQPGEARRLRKQFMLHLALCRAFERGFRCDEQSIRRFFPKFKPGGSRKSPVEQFQSVVRGRLQQDFEKLLVAAGDREPYIQIEYKRRLKTYEMRLHRAALVLKLRF
jgi:hypothetical protein